MSNNPLLGVCACPVCKAKGAEVLKSKEGEGKPYIRCDECVSMIRTSSAKGAREMMAMLDPGKPVAAPVAAPAAPAATAKPAGAPEPEKPVKKQSWLSAIEREL